MSSKQATILVVDDERSVVDLLSEDLVEEGYNYTTAITGEKLWRGCPLTVLTRYC